MVVEGHAHALVGQVVGNLRGPGAERLPGGGAVDLGPGAAPAAHVVDDVPARLGKHHDLGTARLVQREMLLERRNLGLGVTLQQLSRIPTADQAKPMPVEQRAQLPALLGHLAPELDAAEAGRPRLGETGFDRNEIAQPMHAVIGPADRVDAKADRHVCAS